MRMESVDMTTANIDKIEALFPNCITETVDENGKPKKAINFNILKQMLSSEVLDGDEAYEFTWVGKKDAIVEANKPIRKTLRPYVEESKDWDTTENLYIEGDNLEVLKLLQESYLCKVKLIYIDPPYNTGNDFIYRDDFEINADEYDEQAGVYDDNGNRLFKNTDTNGRFHSDWCSMIYSRLLLARNLLTKDGVIAISIGYQEVHNLMKICQELFNDKQVMAVTVQTSGGKPNGSFSITHEYVIFVVPENFDPIPTEEDMKEYSSPYHGMNLATFNQTQRPNQSYPIFVDKKSGCFIGCGKSIQERLDDGSYTGKPGDFIYNFNEAPEGACAIWPITSKGDQCVWRLIPSRLVNDWNKGYIKIVPQSNGKNAFSVQYLSGGIIDKIESGELKAHRISDDNSIPTIDVDSYKTAGAGISTIWTDKQFYTTRGSNEIKDLFEQKCFSYPKPLELLHYIVKRVVSPNEITMDFFSGSATTAHAVMLRNAFDFGNRKFIMIQLPEKCDIDSEAFKSGYMSICEIGKERIRRAGDKIKSETGAEIDYGFRVFKLDDSNMTDVYYSSDEYNQDMLSQLESNVKSDRTDLDLLFGCLLEWGLPLSLSYCSEQIEGYTVHTYNNGDLIACFDENIPDSVVKTIAKRQPLRAVFRDSSFVNSPAKINVTEIFKLLAPDTRVKVI